METGSCSRARSRDDEGRYSAQDIWAADMRMPPGGTPALASAAIGSDEGATPPDEPPTWRSLRRLTEVTSSTFDPVWTEDNHLLFASIEGLSFSVRHMARADSLVDTPRQEVFANLSAAGTEPWEYERLVLGQEATSSEFRKKFQLDVAQGALSQSPVLGTTGGVVFAFSDIMSNDYLYATLFNTGSINEGRFIKDLSVQISRVQLHRRANISYGAYRYAGLRYDLSEPDAPTELPRFF